MDSLDIALGDFGQSLGIAGLVFADDECQLEIGGIFVDLLADRSGQRLVFSALAGEVPQQGKAEALARLLDANCHPAMAGGRLGVPVGSEAVIVLREIGAAGLGGAGLESAMELFLAAVEHARQVLDGAAASKPQAAGAPSFEADTMVLRL